MDPEDETFRRLARITPSELSVVHNAWLRNNCDNRDWGDVLKLYHWSEDEWHQFMRTIQGSNWI